MAHTDWDKRTGHEPDVREPLPGCQAGDLKNLLHSIVDQLSDADRRHSDTLHQMQDRLAGMGREARSLRARVPDQFASAFERIEAGMAELASRITDGTDGQTLKSGIQSGIQDATSIATDPASWAAAASTPHAEAPMALRSAAGYQAHAIGRRDEEPSRPRAAVDNFDVIESSLPGNATDPWDRDSAEALAGIYESGGANFGSAMPSTDPQTPGPRNYVSASFAPSTPPAATSVDTVWFEARFADLTKRLDQSLAEIRPDQGFFDISQRIEQVERHVSGVLDTVATHTDVEGIRLIEAHVGELAGHLDNAHQQLMRLDTIETYLNDISEKLADVHRVAMNPDSSPAAAYSPQQDIDVHAIAHQAAEAAAKRMAEQLPRQQSQGGDDMRGLIERLMSETRQGDENTTALLDTLQQAMIRLLDRVDAMELSHHQSLQSQSAPQEYVREQVRFNVDPHRAQAYAEPEPAYALDAAVAAVASAKTMSSPFMHAPGGSDAPGSENSSQRTTMPGGSATSESRSPEKLRQDFIADARRAKMRLAGDSDSADVVITKPDGVPAASVPTSQKPVIKTSAPSSKSKPASASVQRLMVMGVGALIAVGGLWYTLDGGSNSVAIPVVAKPVSDSPAKTSQAEPLGGQKDKKEARSDARPTGTEGGSSTDGNLSGTSGSENSESGTPELNIQDGTRGEIIPGDMNVGSTTVPLTGIAIDSAKPMTAAEILRAKRQQAMAVVSGKLGQAAAEASNPIATPAAMVPEQDGLGALAGAASLTSIQKSIQKSGMSQSSPLDLPPASVGPLSLRLAAANGDPSAEFQVGARLAEGKGTDQNFADAAKWYQRAASNGFAQAQYRLGTLYERGLGIKADPAKAESWYMQAAELGNIKAMHNLAVMSANQNRSSPDYTTAAKWFTEAAERGLSDSQFNLAVLHENGLGVPQELKQAYKWLALAARSGDTEAIRRRDILRGKLTAEDTAAAEVLIKQWKAKPVDSMANDARSAGDAWKKNPANGVSG